jgi:hypothetical protein
MFAKPAVTGRGKRIRGRVLAAVMLTLISEIAHVSRVHVKAVTLEQLLKDSTHIVVAAPDSPSEATEEVAVVEGGKTYEPYRRHIDRYRVLESLRGDLKRGAAIEVVPANDASREHMHQLYVIEGTTKSYHDPRYEPRAASAEDRQRILFIRKHAQHAHRYSYVAGQSVEGLAMKQEIEQRLKPAAGTGAREARVDAAMRAHGNFGVYGDLRAGLKALGKENTVRLTDVEGGIRVDIVPRVGYGHEYQFVVTPEGKIDNFMAGESAPATPPVPLSLVFQFNHLRLAKQAGTVSLTIEPVWRDAQRAPPPDFELGRRSYRLSAEDFAEFWVELNRIDWPRYARVTEADFETTPPDLRHTEWLAYSVNGQTIASWGEGYKWLRPELRAPLLGLQGWLTRWADEKPASAPGAFRRVMLRDVEGLNGGQNVYVYDNGRVIVQVMPAAQGNSGLLERRYEWKLKAKELDEFKHLLAKHPPREMGFGRPGIPGEAQVEIEVIAESGVRLSMRQWVADAKDTFSVLHKQLLRYAEATAKRKPDQEGKYDDDWRPEGVGE